MINSTKISVRNRKKNAIKNALKDISGVYMEHLNESIQSNLALEIAQLTLDKATLKAQVDYLTKQNAELQQQLDEATAPQN